MSLKILSSPCFLIPLINNQSYLMVQDHLFIYLLVVRNVVIVYEAASLQGAAAGLRLTIFAISTQGSLASWCDKQLSLLLQLLLVYYCFVASTKRV